MMLIVASVSAFLSSHTSAHSLLLREKMRRNACVMYVADDEDVMFCCTLKISGKRR